MRKGTYPRGCYHQPLVAPKEVSYWNQTDRKDDLDVTFPRVHSGSRFEGCDCRYLEIVASTRKVPSTDAQITIRFWDLTVRQDTAHLLRVPRIVRGDKCFVYRKASPRQLTKGF